MKKRNNFPKQVFVKKTNFTRIFAGNTHYWLIEEYTA